MTWRVRGQNKKAYSLEYDNLNRLESADYIEIDDNNQIVTASQDGYNMAATYDLNGNIETMNRKGATTIDANGLATAFGVIDDMTYIYGSNSNELQKIYESSTAQVLTNNGFKDNGINMIDYTYDENGNVTYDTNKDVNITYNHLNLPTRFEWSTNQYIEITYDAAGVKLTKTKYLSGTTTVKHYVNQSYSFYACNGQYSYAANFRQSYNLFPVATEHERPLTSDIVLYPNPARSQVNIKLANESITINNIRIFNLTGQEIPVYMVFNNQIDISHLTAGYYIIQVETDTETIQKKLVVF